MPDQTDAHVVTTCWHCQKQNVWSHEVLEERRKTGWLIRYKAVRLSGDQVAIR